jgi:hypothetical protein
MVRRVNVPPSHVTGRSGIDWNEDVKSNTVAGPRGILTRFPILPLLRGRPLPFTKIGSNTKIPFETGVTIARVSEQVKSSVCCHAASGVIRSGTQAEHELAASH